MNDKLNLKYVKSNLQSIFFLSDPTDKLQNDKYIKLDNTSRSNLKPIILNQRVNAYNIISSLPTILSINISIENIIFNWDGSYIGELNSYHILEKVNHGKRMYWKIIVNGVIRYIIVNSLKDYSPIIIDEMKPCFGIDKNGTHSFKYIGKYYLMTKCIINNGIVMLESSIKDIKIIRNNSFIKSVQRIITFKDIMMINNSESTIGTSWKQTKDGKNKPVAISLRDTTINLNSREDYTPETLINKWFGNKSLEETLVKISKVKTPDDIIKYVYNIKLKMTNIVERIDSSLIYMIDLVIRRLNSMLYIGLNTERRIKIYPEVIEKEDLYKQIECILDRIIV